MKKILSVMLAVVCCAAVCHKIIYTDQAVKNPLALAFTTRQAAALVLEKRKVSNTEKILDRAEQTEEWIRFENEIQDIF